jgi:hypothetical protein
MDAAIKLFDTLKDFKHDDGPGQSSQRRLIDYCTNVLGAIERFHVDFKEKSDRRDAKMSDDDKKNLAKAVSGFANSGGGVLIWGIEDGTIAAKPIAAIYNFVSSMLSLAPQLTDPPVQGIDGDWIPSDSGTRSEGFGLVYIPESLLPPHRVLLKQEGIKDHYFIRSGESFVIASHTQLEDMFGRRPQPKLSLSKRIVIGSRSGDIVHLRIMLGIENSGRGAAKSPFLSVRVNAPYKIATYGIDGNLHFGLTPLVHSMDAQDRRYGSSADVVIYPNITHDVTCIEAEIDKSLPSNISDLVIYYAIAAEGARPVKGQETISGRDLLRAAS